MESMIDRQDADAVEFLERCHDALRQHTGGNPGPYLEPRWRPAPAWRDQPRPISRITCGGSAN